MVGEENPQQVMGTLLMPEWAKVVVYLLMLYGIIQEAVVKFPEFFDIIGLVHHEFIPLRQSVTDHFYMQVSQRSCNAFRNMHHDKWQGQWFLHYINSTSHTSLVV
jgi:hypothetical protein